MSVWGYQVTVEDSGPETAGFNFPVAPPLARVAKSVNAAVFKTAISWRGFVGSIPTTGTISKNETEAEMKPT